MSHLILHELAHHKYLQEALAAQYPEADEETLLDTLEGMTNLHEMIAAVVRSRLDDLAFASAVRARISDMQARLARFEERADKKKEVITHVMDRAALKKITEADFTLSLRPTGPPLVIVDEKQIPDDFWRPQPAKLDRTGLTAALKTGKDVPGAMLGNGGVTISVRTK
jgi:hypothetical protein